MSALALLATLLVSSVSAPVAQDPPKDEIFKPAYYLEKSMISALAMAQQLEDSQPLIGLADGSSVFAGHLAPGQSLSMGHPCKKGEALVAIATPDDPKLNINIWIEDGKGKELAKDDSADAGAVGIFKANEDIDMEFRIKNEGAEDAFVTVVLLSSEGKRKKIEKVAESMDALMAGVRTMAVLDEDLSFASQGEWCLYGGWLDKEKSFSISGLELKAPVSLILGACDKGSTDIDLLLSDKDGKNLAKDEEKDNRPLLEYKSTGKGHIATLGNAGEGAFCLMTVLDGTK